jgi:2-octaprenylphenol hydroxylase
MQQSQTEFDAALTEALDFKLGKLKSITERKQFPLIMRHAQEYVHDHFALVGDAAHTIHPLAGLGVNLGLMDAACLTQVLIDARLSKKSISSFRTLRQYTRWRKSENETIITGMRFLKETFAIDTPWFNIARSTGMSVIDQSNCIKNWLMRIVTGGHDDQPNFLLK